MMIIKNNSQVTLNCFNDFFEYKSTGYHTSFFYQARIDFDEVMFYGLFTGRNK
jgi:hypothetical protein